MDEHATRSRPVAPRASPRPRRTWAALSVAGLVLVGAPAAAAPPALGHALRGAAAVQALEGHERALALHNRTTPDRLAAVLREDGTFGLDRRGRLVVTETTVPRPAGPAQGPARAALRHADDDVFALHSRPGSTRTILLDFDGHVVSGTDWNLSLGPAARQPAFDTDGSPGSWSQSELDLVAGVHQRVAEDFAPFDVDVTTEDPGEDGLLRSSSGDAVYGTRVLITPSRDAARTLCADACGGIAYVGVLDLVGSNTASQPAWVFSHMLSDDEKYIAEAASHEIGHNAGLWHHGTADAEYHWGSGRWAPIMGVGYYAPLVQWSSGDYPGASRPWQDDLAVMQAHGLRLRPDDHGSSWLGAAPLGHKSTTVRGVVATREDRDAVRLDVRCDGPLDATLTPSVRSPNLDSRLLLLDGAGRQVAVDAPDPSLEPYGGAGALGASLRVKARTGTYYAVVEGVGSGAPDTGGYSDYGSLGAYTLEVRTCGRSGT